MDKTDTAKLETMLQNAKDSPQELLDNPGEFFAKHGLKLNFPEIKLDEFPYESKEQIMALANKEPTQLLMELKGKCWVDKKYYGWDLNMDEEFTQQFISGSGDATTLAGAISGVIAAMVGAGPAGIIAAAIVLVLFAKYLQLKIVDKGKGLYFPIYYTDVVALVASASAGVSGVAATLMVLLNPHART